MGICTSKPKSSPKSNFHHTSDEIESDGVRSQDKENPISSGNNDENATSSGNFEEKKANEGKKSLFFPFYSPSPAHYLFSKKSPARSPAPGTGTTPEVFQRTFSAAVSGEAHQGGPGAAPWFGEAERGGDSGGEGGFRQGGFGHKSFGFSEKFYDKYELGEEVGRGQLKVNVFLEEGKK